MTDSSIEQHYQQNHHQKPQHQQHQKLQESIGLSLDHSERDVFPNENMSHNTLLEIAVVEVELKQRILHLKEQLQQAMKTLEDLKKVKSNSTNSRIDDDDDNVELDSKPRNDSNDGVDDNDKLVGDINVNGTTNDYKNIKNKNNLGEERNTKTIDDANDTTTTKDNPSSSVVVSNTTAILPIPLLSQLSPSAILITPTSKRGYLFKWLDRSIGWGGTKWALRFVIIEKGKLAYYNSHNDTTPKYVLSLKGCAVKNDGYKHNKRYLPKPKNSKDQKKVKSPKQVNNNGEIIDPPLDEPGAYFFLFAIYQRNDMYDEDHEGIEENEENVVPLLRFSTPSTAERNMWIQCIEESCAYCDTDEYMIQEQQRAAEMDRQVQEQQRMTNAMPSSREGTLPPLYFAPPTATAKKSTLHRSRPSFSKIPSKSNLKSSLSRNFDSDQKDAKSTKGYPPSKPMHRCNGPSYLSFQEAPPIQNYRGFFNLGIIILIISNIRLISVSITSHGFVIHPKYVSSYFYHLPSQIIYHPNPWSEFPYVIGCLLQIASMFITFLIEYLLGTQRIKSEGLGMTLHHINAHGSIITIIYIVWNFIHRPTIGAILLVQGTITWMKSISYFLCNQDYRLSMVEATVPRRKSFGNGYDMTMNQESSAATLLALVEDIEEKDRNITYPNNITLGNIIYFWCCPSLTYQIAFPKTKRIRLLVVVDIIMKMIISVTIFMFVAIQIVSPALNSLVRDLVQSNGIYTTNMLMEYWLKLSVANTYLWLIFFYIYFHLFFNLLSEILRFGDRVFYKDWWNSAEVSAFWRLWNLPVHYWLIRHLYFPCIRLRVSKTFATFVVFLASAIMHEVLVSVPFHMMRPWSFLGMMMQIPLVAITKYLYRSYPGSSIGNMIFWISFCVVGQPMAILLYTADYNYKQLFQEHIAAGGSGNGGVDMYHNLTNLSECINDQCLVK